jgi:hypothetical protein
MNNKFWAGFTKQAGFKSRTLSKILYNLSRGIPVKMKGISKKSIRRTIAGKKL